MNPQDSSRGLGAAALGLFVVSFLAPAVKTTQGGQTVSYFLLYAVGSADANAGESVSDRAAPLVRVAIGLVSPAMALALVCFFSQRYLCTGVLASAAFASGLISFWALYGTGALEVLRVGAYFWLASMVMLAIAADRNWRYCLIGRPT